MKEKFPSDFSLHQSMKKIIKTGKLHLEQYYKSFIGQMDTSEPSSNSDMDILLPKQVKKMCSEADAFDSYKSPLSGDQFWDSNREVFKGLYKIYSSLRSVQLTSASIERIFSKANLVFDDLAANMETNTILYNLIQ